MARQARDERQDIAYIHEVDGAIAQEDARERHLELSRIQPSPPPERGPRDADEDEVRRDDAAPRRDRICERVEPSSRESSPVGSTRTSVWLSARKI